MSFASDSTQASIGDGGRAGDNLPARVAVSLMLAMALALIVTLMYRHLEETRRLIHAQATEIAATAAEFARFDVAANDRVALAFRLEALTHFSDVRAIVIMDRREQTLAAALRNSAGNLSASPDSTIELERMGHDAPPASLLTQTGDSFVVRAAIGEIAPIGWVYLEYDNHWLLSVRRAFVLGVAGTTLLLAGALALLWHVRRAR